MRLRDCKQGIIKRNVYKITKIEIFHHQKGLMLQLIQK